MKMAACRAAGQALASALIGAAFAYGPATGWLWLCLAAAGMGFVNFAFGFWGVAGACVFLLVYPHFVMAILGAGAGWFLGLCANVELPEDTTAAGASQAAARTRCARAAAAAEESPLGRRRPSAQEEDLTSTASGADTRMSTVAEAASNMVADKRVQVTAASAAGGAVVAGVGGGAVGLASGGAIGAAVGIVPAFFTFGLSIPVGAALGAATGLGVGTAVGGTAGLVGGGAAGYGAYGYKEQIGDVVGGWWSRARALSREGLHAD